MFFSPELLAKRDSGFGFLWLAATLGSKSTFKKLSKRSVMTADIAKLCDMIAEPAEPLALRLSSNLMVGVARVYKVKQEMFMTDVTTCFNSLKKVQEIQSSASDAQLHMAQPSVRPAAVTLAADPAFGMDFDNLVADWDEYLNITDKPDADASDDDFDPKSKKSTHKQKAKTKSLPLAESARTDLHTLKEHHDHLLSASYDASFNRSGALDPSSSQAEGGLGFGFDDNFFGGSDAIDVGGGIGDELARELGEGWGAVPVVNQDSPPMDVDAPMSLGMEMGIDLDFDFGGGFRDMAITSDAAVPVDAIRNALKLKQTGSDKENLPPSSIPGSDLTPRSVLSPVSFSQQLLSQDLDREKVVSEPQIKPAPKKAKRVRLLLDCRTELTDEELKVARSRYLEGQDNLRRDMELRKSEKESGKIIDDLIWGIPNGLQAQDLIEFWSENFKVQVEARSGAIHIDSHVEPPRKRRKVRNPTPVLENLDDENEVGTGRDELGMYMGGGDMGMWMDDGLLDGGNMGDRLRSSEEPGQARRDSRPPSVLGDNFGFDLGTQDAQAGSQRSSLFPWDHAGASSSDAPVFDPADGKSDRISIDRAEIRLRRSRSGSRRESSLAPSHVGNGVGGVDFSPAPLDVESHLVGEDFAFDLSADKSALLESQQSDLNLITLERNSFNFLEYARMQFQGLPDSVSLAFNNVVPNATSTRRVAAAGFYHCLVLATKDLVRLSQPVAYGTLTIIIA